MTLPFAWCVPERRYLLEFASYFRANLRCMMMREMWSTFKFIVKVFFSQCVGFQAFGKRLGGGCDIELLSRYTEGLTLLHTLWHHTQSQRGSEILLEEHWNEPRVLGSSPFLASRGVRAGWASCSDFSAFQSLHMCWLQKLNVWIVWFLHLYKSQSFLVWRNTYH